MTATRNTWSFLIVALVIAAHTLRNFSPLYLLLYGIVGLWALVAFLRSGWRERLSDRGAVLVTWLCIALTGAVMTAGLQSPAVAVGGLSRFLFSVPIIFALIAWTDNRRELHTHITSLAVVFTLQTLTLPLQFVTGPLAIFARVEERGGLVRYASAVGSVTSVGIIVGCYLILAQGARLAWRIPLMLLMSGATIVSLSKAAIANLIIAWLLVLFLNRRHKALVTTAVVGIPAVFAALYVFVQPVRDRIATSLVSFGINTTVSEGNGDYDVIQSIIQRITELPGRNYAALHDLSSPLVYLFGGGFGMGDTALVSQGNGLTIMAHNQLIESITVFGLLGGLLQWGLLALLFAAILRRRRAANDPLFSVMGVVALDFFINSVFANGTLYNPMSGIIVWLMMFTALSTTILSPRDQGASHAVQ